MRIAGADAALLAPAASPDQLRRGFTGTTWLDKARHVIRFKATVPFGGSRATIDERFSDFGAPVQIALPRAETVYDPSVEMVRRLVVAAVADVKAWNADHAKTTGYTGVTAAKLRRLYDPNLSKHLKVVTASRNTYCIEATLNGITVKKDGPPAQIVVGRCPR